MYSKLVMLAATAAVVVIAAPDQTASGSPREPSPIFPLNTNATVDVDFAPSSYIITDDADSINMKARFLAEDGTMFGHVTYRIEIWRDGELLVRNFFYDQDGRLDVEIRPNSDCNHDEKWRCIIYKGQEHVASTGALFAYGEPCTDWNLDTCARPIIEGPVFDKVGPYHIRVHIASADHLIVLDDRHGYSTYFRVAQEQDFVIRTAHGEDVPIVIKTYHNEVRNFAFDPADNSITFDMEFDWTPEYVDLVQMVQEEVRIPKSFLPYAGDAQFHGYVNGVEVDQKAMLNDPYSYDDANVVHFLITNGELQRISQAMKNDYMTSKNMSLRLVPAGETSTRSTEVYLASLDAPQNRAPTSVVIEWDRQHVERNDSVPFRFTFLDEDQNLIRHVWYGYVASDNDGRKTAARLSDGTLADAGVFSGEGISVQHIKVPPEGLAKIDVIVYGTGPGRDPTHAGRGAGSVDVRPSLSYPYDTGSTYDDTVTAPDISATQAAIPAWIKTVAGWWADGAVDDAAFVSALEYLAQNDMLVVPADADTDSREADGDGAESSVASKMPAWIKTVAGWWADGAADDAAFVEGVQYMIREGIMLAARPSS